MLMEKGQRIRARRILSMAGLASRREAGWPENSGFDAEFLQEPLEIVVAAVFDHNATLGIIRPAILGAQQLHIVNGAVGRHRGFFGVRPCGATQHNA
jgi:hypothetical protein